MGEYRWNNLAHVIDAIGMSSTEMSRFLETRGIKRSPRTIRRWSQVGVVAYHDDTWKVKYIVEAVWKAIDNYAGTETLPDGLPQRIVDRCHTIAAMREDEADRDQMRISLNWDSGFRKSRTSVSLSRGQRMRSISGCLVSVTGD